jgi:DNA primase
MDDVAKIKSKIDIVEVISEYIPLKKMGRNFKCPCPFHQEKSPSFTVSPERQIWHCFGCSKGGDVFSFLMEYEHIEFGEALKILADKANVTLTASPLRTERENKRDMIFKLNSLAAQFYNFLLTKHPSGKNALSYLTEKRKTPIALINTFNLGFAPSQNALSTFLTKKKGYKDFDIVDAGLAFRGRNGLQDFFHNRIIFPITDSRGNIVAFSGRALDNLEESGPKYVNTRETAVYIKGDTVFGLNLAKDAIKKEGKVIIVEGEFDVITSHREGIDNIVAVKGTALTENQIRLLKRFAKKLVFCFDTDPAGTEAQRRSIELIEKEGVSAAVIVPPQGKDPDELLNENPSLFKKAIKNDIHIYDFIIDSALGASDSKTVDGKEKILQKTLPFLAIIDNEVLKEHYLKKLADALSTSLESVTRQAEKVGKKEAPRITAPIGKKESRQETLEGYLLSLVLQSEKIKQTVLKVELALSGIPFSIAHYKRIFVALSEYCESVQSPQIAGFVEILPEELRPAVDALFLAPIPQFAEIEQLGQEIEKVSMEVKSLSIKDGLQKLSEKIVLAEKENRENDLIKLQEEFKTLSNLTKPAR